MFHTRQRWGWGVFLLCLGLDCACPPPRPPDAVTVARPAGSGAATPTAPDVMLVPQDGHAVEAEAVAYSADGRFLATGGFDQSLRVWDGDGVLRASFHCDGEKVYEVAFSRRGDAVAGACAGRVWIWELASGKLRASFGENVIGFAWSPDGARIATAGRIVEPGRTPLLEIWSAKSGARERSAAAPRGRQLVSVDWSRDGRKLATGSLDGNSFLWDAATLTPSALPIGVGGRRIAFSPDGGRIAGDGPNGLTVVDLATAAETRLGQGDDFAWSEDGKAIAVNAGNSVVELRDTRSGSVLTRVRQRARIERVALAPDGSAVAIVGVDDPVVRVLDIKTGREIHALGAGSVERRHVTFSADGALLAVTGVTVELWDPQTGALLRTLDAYGRRVSGTALSPDGAHVAASVGKDTARVWSTSTGDVEATITAANPQDLSWSFAWLPAEASRGGAASAGSRGPLLVAAVGSELRRWTPGGTPARLELDPEPWIVSLSVSPEGRTLAVASLRAVVLVDTASFEPRARLELDSSNWYFDPAWSPDGKLLATSAGPSIQIWSAADGRLLGAAGNRSMFCAASFSPDGRWLAFAGGKKTLELWPANALAGRSKPPRQGTAAAMAPRPAGALSVPFPRRARSLAVSPDGRFVAAGSDERDIVLWDARELRRRWGDQRHNARVWSLEWHPGGGFFASASTGLRLYRAADGAAITLRTAALPGPRHVAYAHSDTGAVSGEPDALATLRFRTGGDAFASKLVPFEAVAAAVHRPELMADFWAGKPVDP